jgi:hypothetical protein
MNTKRLAVFVAVAVSSFLVLQMALASTLISSQGGFDFPPAPLQLGGVAAADAGSGFVLALGLDGRVTNLTNSENYIKPPSGLSNVIALSSGNVNALALTRDGTVVAWGSDGNSSVTNVPVGLSNVVAIAAGDNTDLALLGCGTVVSWGDSTNVPASLSNVVSVVMNNPDLGEFALQANGAVVAWGGAASPPPSLSNVIAIAASQLSAYNWAGLPNDSGALALLADGTVTAWNNRGVATNPLPAGVSNVVAVSGNLNGFLALRADGSVIIAGDKAPLPTFPVTLTNVFYISPMSFGNLVVLEGDGSPVFTVQPGNQTTPTGGTIYLHARLVAAEVPYQLQWQLNGADILGATNGDLVIDNATGTNAGNYQAVATYDFGLDTAASSVATVTVLPSAPVTALLSAPALQPDGSLLISVNLTNGVPVPLTNSSSFQLQASTDLINWTSLTMGFTLENGAIDITKPLSQSGAVGFYRLLRQ